MFEILVNKKNNQKEIALLEKGKLVEYTHIAYYDIMKRGIGAMESNSKEMQYKLPFMHFNNIFQSNYLIFFLYLLYFIKIVV